MDFKDLTDDEVYAIENKLNNRPRKVLGYKPPWMGAADPLACGDTCPYRSVLT